MEAKYYKPNLPQVRERDIIHDPQARHLSMNKIKEKIPEGYKIWKRVSVFPFGNYAIIASRGDLVCIFSFDGESENPITIMQYHILK